MMNVEHAGYSVESESVELVLLHPEAKIAEEESHDFVMAIVEQSAVPLVMISLPTSMEVLVICAIELVETIENILRGMAMDHVKEDDQTHTMSSVNELLQILWRPVSAAGREEVVDLIAEAGIVRMLHDCHKLNHIVTQVLDPWKHVFREFLVRCHALLRSGDSDVRFIDTCTLGLCRA
jgi:phosphoenolpyruvate carboxylase